MKKLLFVLIAITAITFSSCKKDKETKAENLHIGTWQVTTINYAPNEGENIKQYDLSGFEDRLLIADINTNGSIRAGEVSPVNSRVCVTNINYTVENDKITFSDGMFFHRLNGDSKLEFKDNNKIVITGSDNFGTFTIELIRTNEKIDDYIITNCLG